MKRIDIIKLIEGEISSWIGRWVDDGTAEGVVEVLEEAGIDFKWEEE